MYDINQTISSIPDINNSIDKTIYLNYWVFEIVGIYLFVQAVIGIIAIEYAWYKTKRYRELNEERDSNFQAFYRLDA